ncbi:Trigger factor [Phycisphaerae bacterium RAS1]|nr:Trigger factor [Phycisphaerae bacterium RAS1]
MELPGLADFVADPYLREKAEKKAQSLLDELKKAVKAEVKDAGVLRKEMRVIVPEKAITDHVAFNFDEIANDAVVPGFRKGRAPRRLIEKRFAGEVRESLKTTILGQSFFAAVESQKLSVLGDPLFKMKEGDGEKLVEFQEALSRLKLPERGDLDYVCEFEVKPTFTLPELKGIPVRSPQITIDDKAVEDEILRQRKVRGHYEPLEGGAAEAEDMIVADVLLTCEGKEVKKEENLQLGLRPSRLDGVPLLTLHEVLKGVKVGDQRSVECTFPDDYERADLRGKQGRFEFTVQELKRLSAQSQQDFMQQLGCESEQELREIVRERMESEVDRLIQRAKREQVFQYLLDKTPIEVPTDLSARQTDRAVIRRVVDLQQNGTPMPEIEARIDELRTSAKEQVVRDLKLSFILEQVAAGLGVSVAEEEVNTEIARIARLYNRRFDRIRDDLQAQGLFPQLVEQLKHDRCVTALLTHANIEQVAVPAPTSEP